MNIENMTNKQKSLAILNSIDGWLIELVGDDIYVTISTPNESCVILTEPYWLYDKKHMWLMWLALNWAMYYLPEKDVRGFKLPTLDNNWLVSVEPETIEPDVFIHIVLDQILTIAISSGLVSDD